jgi:hypothetical protein
MYSYWGSYRVSNKVSSSAVGQLFLANFNMYTIASCALSALSTAFGNPFSYVEETRASQSMIATCCTTCCCAENYLIILLTVDAYFSSICNAPLQFSVPYTHALSKLSRICTKQSATALAWRHVKTVISAKDKKPVISAVFWLGWRSLL